MNDVTFKKAEKGDLDIILDIYNYYILNTTANFYRHPVSREEITQFILIGNEKYQTYLLHKKGEVAGFCFLTQYKKKDAYDHTAEIGVYLRPECVTRGLGSSAVAFLEEAASKKRIRVIVASISGENTGSMKLFEKMGYEKCAHYKEVGEKFGRLLDVVDYQKILGKSHTHQ
jgi:L-amino acid N-acyltransferase YncA